MRCGATVAVIIPARNEEPAIAKVIAAIPAWADDIVVVDNGSADGTAAVAAAAGARVVREPCRGYGAACLTGVSALRDPDVVVFLDADNSDQPEEMAALADPVIAGEADLVIGSRMRGKVEAGALTPFQQFGNRLACVLLRLIWRVPYTDLGPFRAIRHTTLRSLGMRDRGYGWTVEMQIRAAKLGCRVIERPVRYRRRIGRSKISGTVRGTVGAGLKILWLIAWSSMQRRQGA